MRVVFIGVSHWHTQFYLEPALQLPDVHVVGVSDPDAGVAQQTAAPLQCVWATDFRELCRQVQPDFAFVLGRHADMAATCHYLIEQRIAFCVEKPAGVSASEVHALAASARQHGVFAAVPFVMRDGALVQAIRARLAASRVQFLSFRFIAGPISRYRDAGCAWMLDRNGAGGGCLLNLGVHFLDLCQVLTDDAPLQVESAILATVTGTHSVEDYALVGLRSGAIPCVVETGYLYPAPTGVFDLHFSIRAEQYYFAVKDPHTLEIVDAQQRHEVLRLPTPNFPYYPAFAGDVLARFAAGNSPRASLDDMAATMTLVQAAYALGRKP